MKTVLVVTLFIVTIALAQNAGAMDITQKVKTKISEILDKLPEPIVLMEQNIQTNLLNGTLNGTISGITQLETRKVIFKMVGMTIDSFEFFLPKLSVDITSYNLEGKLGFGNGMSLLNLEKIVLKGSAKLDLIEVDGEKYVYIKSVKVDPSLDNSSFKFDITGWLDDENFSDFISDFITNVIRELTPSVKSILDEQLSKILTELISDYKIPLSDLMG